MDGGLVNNKGWDVEMKNLEFEFSRDKLVVCSGTKISAVMPINGREEIWVRSSSDKANHLRSVQTWGATNRKSSRKMDFCLSKRSKIVGA